MQMETQTQIQKNAESGVHADADEFKLSHIQIQTQARRCARFNCLFPSTRSGGKQIASMQIEKRKWEAAGMEKKDKKRRRK